MQGNYKGDLGNDWRELARFRYRQPASRCRATAMAQSEPTIQETMENRQHKGQVHKDSLDNNEDLNYICTNEIIFKVMY